MDNRINFLKTVVPFNLLPDDVLERTAASLIEVRFQKDGIIYRQGVSKLKGIDIIVEGEYETFFYDSNHNKRLIEIYHTGDCYGGITELLIQKKSLRTVIAKKGTMVYTLPRKVFNDLCQSYEEFYQHFTHSLS